MSDFYKLVAIDGKGFGCVATKKIEPGTLIFSEKPAVTALGNCPETIYFKTMMSSFKKLTKNDQKEYMELHNTFDGKLSDEILPSYVTKTSSALVLKVYGIYKTNAFGHGVGGVGIQMSR